MIYFIFLIPSTLLLFLVYVLPIIRYFWLSFHSFSVSTGLEIISNNGANWSRLINDERFWMDSIQTIRFAFLSVSIELLLSIIIALVLNENFRGRSIFRVTTLLPWALPTTIMALGWRWIFNTPYGPINQFIKIFNLNNLDIITNPNLSWITTIIADVWKTTPFLALILLAGLQTIPSDLYDAFKLEGGKPIYAFFKISLPLIKPYLLIGLIFRIAQAFGVFDLIQVMTGGGPAGSTESLALYAYLNAMRYLDFGYSSTIILGGFVITSIATLIACIFVLNLNKLIGIFEK